MLRMKPFMARKRTHDVFDLAHDVVPVSLERVGGDTRRPGAFCSWF